MNTISELFENIIEDLEIFLIANELELYIKIDNNVILLNTRDLLIKENKQ